MSKFLDTIISRAKADKQTIVLPEGNDIRTIQAADMILKAGYANLIILGDEAEISKLAEGLDISGAKIVNPLTDANRQAYADKLYEMRKAKGMTPEQALELISNPLYYGVMMVKDEQADGMVAGACNSTANVLRPSLQILKTAPDSKLVSSFFVMIRESAEKIITSYELFYRDFQLQEKENMYEKIPCNLFGRFNVGLGNAHRGHGSCRKCSGHLGSLHDLRPEFQRHDG